MRLKWEIAGLSMNSQTHEILDREGMIVPYEFTQKHH